MGLEEWVALSLTPGIGGATLRRLLARFGSAPAILAASEPELRAVPGVGEVRAAGITAASPASAHRLMRTLEQADIRFLTWDDPEYPGNLALLPDAPPLLFLRGRLLPADDRAVAIVGTRRPSEAALTASAAIAIELGRRGLTVVSGLALGIDGTAHAGALAAGARTLAVLGSGIRAIHPRRHLELADQIAVHGAVLSELHPDARPVGTQLVARDRLISGLSRWTIVVESGIAGGSMRTAEFARRQGRGLAALPGSPGTDALLAAGAHPMNVVGTDWDALAARIFASPAAALPGPATGQMPLL